MSQELQVRVNGTERNLDGLAPSATLAAVLDALALRADRIAVELNGELAPRTDWTQLQVRPGDKLEVVHFVGGGMA